MPLLLLKDVSIAYGDNALLDRACLTVEGSQRIGLLGRNGEGKSTLLNIICGRRVPDDGEIKLEPGTTIGMLDQTANPSGDARVYDAVAAGLGEIGEWLTEYHRIIEDHSMRGGQQLGRMSSLQQKLETNDGWRLQQRVEKVISRLGLDADARVASLSGGWQRRVSLAKALVADPKILLLDEPTNHLDVDSIKWLENQILQFHGAVIFVTHDRAFLKRVANQIADLDRGRLTIWAGGYEDYLRRKAAFLEQEARQNAEFDRKLLEEEKWIRKGIQARRTRNEGRVRALKKMRAERAERRDHKANVKLQLERAKDSGKLVVEAHDLGFSYNDVPVVRDFSIRILRGDRIGILGPNGIGKTTLIKLLLGQIEPTEGKIGHGNNLQIAFFDQMRDQIDLDATVVDAIGEGRDQIVINGKPKHVISWLSDFLFTPARARSPIRSLSGGERARVLLAKLFSKPTNLLVMDEPTNDLDIETLELLEELLLDFNGTLLLVSHDRQFMDNVVTSTLAMEGNGVVKEYVGGYSDWERQSQKKQPLKKARTLKEPISSALIKAPKKQKLSYKLQLELDQLPSRIEILEARQSTLTESISDPGFYRRPQREIDDTMRDLDAVTTELEQCYQRWDELES